MPALVALLATLAVAATPPAPTRWVEDHAGVLAEADRTALDARLEAYERASGHQIVVWVGTTLDGAPLAEWAVNTFAAWEVGREGIDDGVAVFVFTEDHAIDIEVGYGLEDRVPDAVASRIIDDVMVPRLRANDVAGALVAGTDAMVAAIGDGVVAPVAVTNDGAPSIAMWIIGGIVALALVLLFATHPRALLWLLLFTGRSIVSGGGVFKGGGGRSGGGGARGKW